jgi:hypothetical protein
MGAILELYRYISSVLKKPFLPSLIIEQKVFSQ